MSVLSFFREEDTDRIVEDNAEVGHHQDDHQPSSPLSPETTKATGTTPHIPIITIAKELKKKPAVDTTFLPDRKHQIKVKRERQRTKWIYAQTHINTKNSKSLISTGINLAINATYNVSRDIPSYRFSNWYKKYLAREFYEIQNLTSGTLVYVKEVLIIPQDISCYNLIVIKLRGRLDCYLNSMLMMMLGWEQLIPGERGVIHQGDSVEK